MCGVGAPAVAALVVSLVNSSVGPRGDLAFWKPMEGWARGHEEVEDLESIEGKASELAGG